MNIIKHSIYPSTCFLTAMLSMAFENSMGLVAFVAAIIMTLAGVYDILSTVENRMLEQYTEDLKARTQIYQQLMEAIDSVRK